MGHEYSVELLECSIENGLPVLQGHYSVAREQTFNAKPLEFWETDMIIGDAAHGIIDEPYNSAILNGIPVEQAFPSIEVHHEAGGIVRMSYNIDGFNMHSANVKLFPVAKAMVDRTMNVHIVLCIHTMRFCVRNPQFFIGADRQEMFTRIVAYPYLAAGSVFDRFCAPGVIRVMMGDENMTDITDIKTFCFDVFCEPVGIIAIPRIYQENPPGPLTRKM